MIGRDRSRPALASKHASPHSAFTSHGWPALRVQIRSSASGVNVCPVVEIDPRQRRNVVVPIRIAGAAGDRITFRVMTATVAASAGFRVGHARHPRQLTGCSVILCPEGTVAGVDVRGPAPGSRETALLAVDKPIARLDALLFTGGSAFGLAAADGVMRYLAERGHGHPTRVKPIPLVAASVIYDLLLSEGAAYPDAELGYAACTAARALPLPAAAQGNAGAGTGASVGKWGGPDTMMKGGVGYAERNAAGALVAAVAVVNSVGDVLDEGGRELAGARAADGGWLARHTAERWLPRQSLVVGTGTNTTLVAVLTDAAMSKPEAGRLAQRAHDGIARAVLPAHTTNDGDTAYALAAGIREAPFELIATLAVECVSAAIRNAVLHAAPVGGVPGLVAAPAAASG